jgi:hypothetical protein
MIVCGDYKKVWGWGRHSCHCTQFLDRYSCSDETVNKSIIMVEKPVSGMTFLEGF